MNLRKLILEKNECCIRGTKIKPCGIMVHSTAANNPWLKRYVGPDDGMLGVNQYGNHWNVFHPGGKDIGAHTYKNDGNGKCAVCGGSQVCVHGFIGKLADGTIATYQTLPWDIKGWHAGGSANSKGYIGFEICEDGLTDKAYFNQVYRDAVELTAMLCKQYALDPLADGVVICHAEGYKRGIASNHGDVLHWFPKMGKSMDDFRSDVAAEMGGAAEPVEVNYRARVTASAGLNCRTAPVSGDIIETYPFGTVLTVTRERGGWGFTGDGWVSLEYVEKLTPADTPEEPDAPAQKEDGMTCYKTLDEVPEYYRPTVEKLVEAGALNGTGDGLNVTEDFCRIMTVLDRLGKLD